ncbi:MAG: septal ring lytic transglycosylase RlpA family protein [Desulfovibrio sp.]|nr:septal ring lytic transglycosylase RlpA family protein [Desulfovibrio sp.]
MPHLRSLFSWAAVLLCLALASPAFALAPPGQTAKTKNHKAADKPVSSKSAVKRAKTKKSKAVSVRSRQKKRHAAGKASSGPDTRGIWLERAKGSNMLSGTASWYGGKAHGNATASGITYDMYTFTAAHRTLPIGTVVKVTDQLNGRSVMVCINDRGPYARGRVIDLSYAAAKQIDLNSRGIGKVNLEIVSDKNGMSLYTDKAWYVRYNAAIGGESVGPFRVFADAAAMHEALLQAYPEAEVVMDSAE